VLRWRRLNAMQVLLSFDAPHLLPNHTGHKAKSLHHHPKLPQRLYCIPVSFCNQKQNGHKPQIYKSAFSSPSSRTQPPHAWVALAQSRFTKVNQVRLESLKC